ncbi:MAG: ABC transporter permease [Bryobacterales bacterium]
MQLPPHPCFTIFDSHFVPCASNPAFTAVAVATLALGIGASAGVFNLVQGVLLTPPPYEDPDKLVLVQSAAEDGRITQAERPWAASQWLEWQRQAKSFDAVAAYSWSFSFLIESDRAEPIQGMWVTPEYFSVIGVQPEMGRAFLPEEKITDSNVVVIVSHEPLAELGGDPDIDRDCRRRLGREDGGSNVRPSRRFISRSGRQARARSIW